MIKSASLIARTKGDLYLVQSRDVRSERFSPGKFPYLFPGACGLFGGGVEKGESPEEAFMREMEEELPGLSVCVSDFEHRRYEWKRDLKKVWRRVDEVFCGNLESFLSFDLDCLVPRCALGNSRRGYLDGGEPTYEEFLRNREEHFYVGNVDEGFLEGVEAVEEGKAFWVSGEIVRDLKMYPGDTLAILDDLALRVLDGEVEY